MTYCNSSTKKKLGVSFHDFPADRAVQQKWLKAISRKDFIPNDKSASSVVCSLHFVGDNYSSDSPKRRRLKRTAFPSVFPGYPTYTQPQITQKRQNLERKQPPCAVPVTKVVLCTVTVSKVAHQVAVKKATSWFHCVGSAAARRARCSTIHFFVRCRFLLHFLCRNLRSMAVLWILYRFLCPALSTAEHQRRLIKWPATGVKRKNSSCRLRYLLRRRLPQERTTTWSYQPV
ncbi:hypothetical protein MRX96_022197 [Rhipicephalus microplus]